MICIYLVRDNLIAQVLFVYHAIDNFDTHAQSYIQLYEKDREQ